MAPWVSWSRALAKYAMRHPTVQRMMRDGGRRLASLDVVQRGRRLVSTLAARAASITQEKAAAGAEKNVPHFSMYNRLRRRTVNAWYQHRARLLSFLFANFMAIIIVLQLLGAAWQSLRPAHKPRSVTTEAEGERQQQPPLQHRRRHRDATAEAAAMAVLNTTSDAQDDAADETLPRTLDSPPPPLRQESSNKAGVSSTRDAGSPFAFYEPPSLSTSSALFDDVTQQQQQSEPVPLFSLSDMKEGSTDLSATAGPVTDAPINFDTSFLVKMDDERDFTSSLDRAHLTGKVQVDPLSGRPST